LHKQDVYNHKTSLGFIAWKAIFGIQKSLTPQRQAFLRLSKTPEGVSDNRLAVCCAQNLCAIGAQIPHLQPEKYFLSRTCRERK